MQQWQYVFLIAAAIIISTGFIWVFTADATLASWNQPKTSPKSTKDEEMETLKKSPENEPIVQKDTGGIENLPKN